MMKRTLLVMVLMLILLMVAGSAGAVDVQQVQQALRNSGAQWTAGETSMSHLSAAEMAGYCNLQVDVPSGDEAFEEPMPVAADMPAHLDWRDINGQDFTTPIKQQHPCGTCATFSSIGATEALIKIALDNPFIIPDISEQAVYSCEGFMPYTFFHPLAYLKNSGGADDACMPYDCDTPTDRPPCEDQCDDWASRVFKIKSYKMMMWPSPEQIKTALQNGPIVAGFQVFEDFQAYTGGVYEHTTGKLLGGHGVVVVGYDDAEQYWICKNSWGTDWGEDGWFRIKWGTGFLQFGYQSFQIEVDAQQLCANDEPPTISELKLVNEAEACLGEEPQITFGYADTHADVAGGELWYSIDGGAETRYPNPLVELTGTSSAGREPTVFTLPESLDSSAHTLTVYVKDLCGNPSNELSLTVNGEDDDNDDDAASDDDGTDDDASADDGDDDDDDNSGGCGA